MGSDSSRGPGHGLVRNLSREEFDITLASEPQDNVCRSVHSLCTDCFGSFQLWIWMIPSIYIFFVNVVSDTWPTVTLRPSIS